MEKRIARFHVGKAIGRADASVTAADDEEVPLGEMKVVGADGGAGGYAAKLQIKGMTTTRKSDVAPGTEREAEITVERVKFFRGRVDLVPRERSEVGVVHKKTGATLIAPDGE